MSLVIYDSKGRGYGEEDIARIMTAINHEEPNRVPACWRIRLPNGRHSNWRDINTLRPLRASDGKGATIQYAYF